MRKPMISLKNCENGSFMKVKFVKNSFYPYNFEIFVKNIYENTNQSSY